MVHNPYAWLSGNSLVGFTSSYSAVHRLPSPVLRSVSPVQITLPALFGGYCGPHAEGLARAWHTSAAANPPGQRLHGRLRRRVDGRREPAVAIDAELARDKPLLWAVVVVDVVGVCTVAVDVALVAGLLDGAAKERVLDCRRKRRAHRRWRGRRAGRRRRGRRRGRQPGGGLGGGLGGGEGGGGVGGGCEGGGGGRAHWTRRTGRRSGSRSRTRPPRRSSALAAARAGTARRPGPAARRPLGRAWRPGSASVRCGTTFPSRAARTTSSTQSWCTRWGRLRPSQSAGSSSACGSVHQTRRRRQTSWRWGRRTQSRPRRRRQVARVHLAHDDEHGRLERREGRRRHRRQRRYRGRRRGRQRAPLAARTPRWSRRICSCSCSRCCTRRRSARLRAT